MCQHLYGSVSFKSLVSTAASELLGLVPPPGDWPACRAWSRRWWWGTAGPATPWSFCVFSAGRTAVTCSPLPPAARRFPGWVSFFPRPPRLSKGPELVDYSSSRWGNPSLSCRTAKVLKCLASLWVASTEIPSRQVVTLTLSTEKDISPGKTFTSFLTSQSEILFLFLLQIFLYTSFEE